MADGSFGGTGGCEGVTVKDCVGGAGQNFGSMRGDKDCEEWWVSMRGSVGQTGWLWQCCDIYKFVYEFCGKETPC